MKRCVTLALGMTMSDPRTPTGAPDADAALQRDLTVYIDGTPFSVLAFYRSKGFDTLPPTVTLSGMDVRAMSGRDRPGNALHSCRLHRTASDIDPGVEVSNLQAIIINGGESFYFVPPATTTGLHNG